MAESLNFDSFDVLIIGGGAAGLYTALSFPTTVKIAIVTKDTLKHSASDWAQGGIAAAMRPDDSPSLHANDTFNAGVGLCDSTAVEFLVHHSKEQINKLVEMGVAFDRQQQQLALTLEAAHSRPRVLHAADATGKALIKTLTNQALLQENIHVFSEMFSLDLSIESTTNRCQGVLAFYQGRFIKLMASFVVLATGGGGQVFSQTTNPALSTGDGVAMAWRSGAILRDLEFFQFHPTALKVSGAPRFLISEAVRGEGAHLIDHKGHRFMFDYHELGELAPRDVVSRSIVKHLAQSGKDHVLLDLSVISTAQVKKRFPKIIRVCQSWGIDVFRQPIPVSPAAHYWMGGIQTDVHAKTSIQGLYAVGEVASTGVHGSNRLASNSLLECLVFGASLAKHIMHELVNLPVLAPLSLNELVLESQSCSMSDDEWKQIQRVRQQLPDLIWQSAGIVRNAQGLNAALRQLENWQQDYAQTQLNTCISRWRVSNQNLNIQVPPEMLRQWAETRNLLDIAVLIVRSALFRQESRGGHLREDYPYTSPQWLSHTLIHRSNLSTSKIL